MITAKKIVLGIALFTFLFTAGVCLADSAIPNLVGAWTVTAEGGVLLKGGAFGWKTHHSGDFSVLTAEAVINKQQGRVVHGVFTSLKATEKFVCVISFDNKGFHCADEDGTMDGKIISKNKIEIVYRHVTNSDTVVGVGTWTRK